MSPILFLMGVDDQPLDLYRQVPTPPQPGYDGSFAPLGPQLITPPPARFAQDAFGAVKTSARRITRCPRVLAALDELMRAPIRERWAAIKSVADAYREGGYDRIRAQMQYDRRIGGPVRERDALAIALGREFAATLYMAVVEIAQRGDFSPLRVPMAPLPGAGVAWAGGFPPMPPAFSGVEGVRIVRAGGERLITALHSVVVAEIPRALRGTMELVPELSAGTWGPEQTRRLESALVARVGNAMAALDRMFGPSWPATSQGLGEIQGYAWARQNLKTIVGVAGVAFVGVAIWYKSQRQAAKPRGKKKGK